MKNIGNNTESCSDSNGNDEFKCECKEGFYANRCECFCDYNDYDPCVPCAAAIVGQDDVIY